ARHSPLSPAPRRIRSTLYCVGVIPYGLSASENECSSTAHVRPMLRNASCSGLLNGLACRISARRSGDILPIYVLKHVLARPERASGAISRYGGGPCRRAR